jgi:hypothetical protein
LGSPIWPKTGQFSSRFLVSFLRVIINLIKSILYISQNQRLKWNSGTFPQVK